MTTDGWEQRLDDLGQARERCTCGGSWPCTGPGWMGDHSLVVTQAETWRPCGGPDHDDDRADGNPTSDICQDCEPRPCADCGEAEHPSLPRCDCWVDLSTLAPADVKALFARGGWSLGTDGQVTP